MIDSIAIALALVATPAARPNMDRNVRVIAPVQVASIYMKHSEEHASNELTTCYENRSGSCWIEE
jgi:hypothetical protein